MEPRTSVINKRLGKIDRIICVASGKGGVGKSLIASSLALSLVKNGHSVGLLDLDLYGPSSHVILGVETRKFPEEEKGIIPPLEHGIRFMSLVYFSEDKSSAFRGDDISNIILELLAITQWGHLDYLIIDMPPGIGDETLDVIRYIKESEFLVITTPSKVAMNAVRKLLLLLKEIDVPLVGVVENMKMKESSYIKKETSQIGAPFLGSVLFDPDIENSIGNPEKLAETPFFEDVEKILKNIER